MEESKMSISNMEDYELKQAIIKLNNDKLKNINNSSYLNAFGAITSLTTILDKREKFDYLKGLAEVELFEDYVDKAIELVNEVRDEESHLKNLEDAKELRAKLYQFARIVEGYYIELAYVGNIIDQYGLMTKASEYDKSYSTVDTDKIVDLVHEKLEIHKSDYRMYNHIISQIVQFIPIRLTKDKYINTIENSMKRNLQSLNERQVEDKINNYKRQWDSSLQYGYGFKFVKYFALIEKLKKEDIAEKNLEELDAMVDRVIALTNNINELYNFILIMGLTYNMIITMYLVKDNSIYEEYNDLKVKWEKALESREEKDIQSFVKANEIKIKEIESKTNENMEEFQELNNEAVKREDFIDEELENIFLYTKEILTYYNDYSLGNIETMLSAENKEVSSVYLDECIKSLSSYISRSLSSMSNVERKVRMKQFLSLIELPFSNINEFEDYIRYSLNSRVSSSKETLIIMDNIVGFIQNIDRKN